ncbi:MAG TPA: hypothetical protein VGQ65_07810 [Thermoanaerobaculia bacterium]|jgi:hypothetical protein|nr:hypothetical protein [Thermoanaerobaculia bacterium]
MRDIRRITLIARGAAAPAREWDASARAANRIIFVDTFEILKGALGYAAEDVDRLFIDCAATESQFLDLLTTLPGDFIGDVLFVNGDERSFLSTTCRSGGRLLYAMLPADVRFYLEAQRLVTKVAIAA